VALSNVPAMAVAGRQPVINASDCKQRGPPFTICYQSQAL